MIALIDEAAREGRDGIYYVVAAAVLLRDPTLASSQVAEVVPPNRTRPFHWHKEGPVARERMVGVLSSLEVSTRVAVFHPTGRKRQERARSHLLAHHVEQLVYSDVVELRIESRDLGSGGRQDGRDRSTILGVEQALEVDVIYSHAPKTDPLLWLADAVASVAAGWLLGEDSRWFKELQDRKVIGELEYFNESSLEP